MLLYNKNVTMERIIPLTKLNGNIAPVMYESVSNGFMLRYNGSSKNALVKELTTNKPKIPTKRPINAPFFILYFE